MEFDLSGKSGMNQEELRAQEALEAQLKQTESMIHEMLTDHPHFTDDCGEYLRSALELSAALMSAREDGVENLVRWFKEAAEDGQFDGYSNHLNENYACDGISDEAEMLVMAYIERSK